MAFLLFGIKCRPIRSDGACVYRLLARWHVAVIDLETVSVISKIKVGSDPDGLALGATVKLIFA